MYVATCIPCVNVLKSGYRIHVFLQTNILSYMKLNEVLMGFVSQNGWSPLHKASQEGHLDVVKTLLEAGAYINQADKVSSTHTCTCTYMFMT